MDAKCEVADNSDQMDTEEGVDVKDVELTSPVPVKSEAPSTSGKTSSINLEALLHRTENLARCVETGGMCTHLSLEYTHEVRKG